MWCVYNDFFLCIIIGGQPIACPWFTSGVGSITLADISCNDNALRLIDCNHLPVGTANCNHLQDLGIRCNPRKTK